LESGRVKVAHEMLMKSTPNYYSYTAGSQGTL
jgi:hypothetical protein